jgi:hypothetical protein
VPHLQKGHIAVDELDGWWVLGAEAEEIAGGLAASPLAAPAFFLGWIGIGVLVGLGLARRGHHRRTMAALGVGLGPLMFVVASDAVKRRERETRPLVLSPGVDHGGELDILVHIQHSPEHIRSVAPTLRAVESDIGTLTLARTVGYEWLEDDADNDVVASASSALLMARDLVPIRSPALVVFPGTVDATVRRFAARSRRTLLLVAIDESTAVPGRW